MPETAACPVCGGSDPTPVLEAAGVPVFCNVLWQTREEALAAPRGDISLVFCERCGVIRNAAFDAELVRYSPGYENSLHSSATFRQFAEELARRLVDTYALRDKRIVDIGSGRGEFLELLCAGTGNEGVGFDPSYGGFEERTSGVTIVPEYYSEAHAGTPADLICCRHVLEHLEDPGQLLALLAGSSAPVYFEVPNGEYMLREAAIWDVIYEHVSYFTRPALRQLFARFGFKTLDVGASFGDQYLHIEAARNGGTPRESASGADLVPLVAEFARRRAEKVATWTSRLATYHADGRAVALWGTGSKGVTFLNVVPGADRIQAVVDLNELKHGRFVPGTAQEVVGPAGLVEHSPDVVLATNVLYVDEIGAELRKLGLTADVVPV